LDRLALSEHRFDVVAIGIENECSVITRRIAAGAKSRPAIVVAAGRESRTVKGLNLLPASGSKGRVLLCSVCVKDVYPEDRIGRAVPHAAEFVIVRAVRDLECLRNPYQGRRPRPPNAAS
jgi:hypothetical protein